VRPRSLGQRADAGITPAAISILAVHIRAVAIEMRAHLSHFASKATFHVKHFHAIINKISYLYFWDRRFT